MVNLKLQFPGDSFRDPLYPPILKIAYIAIESVTPRRFFTIPRRSQTRRIVMFM